MIKLVIFDCDGVLVDSEPATLQVIAQSLTRYGLEMSADDVERNFVGGALKDLGVAAATMGAVLPDNWIDETYADMFTQLRKGVAVIDGILPLLDKLEAARIATAIVSNGPLDKMAITLAPSGLWDRFQGRIYSAHDHNPKPSPDMLLKACAQAGVTVDQAVMIDDSAAGCKSAQAAPMRCFGFDTHGNGAHLAAVGATPVHHINDITKALGL
ncbi:MAG: HAD superfamily hydrolase (TIGR01509 family) [Yoonia sp.]